MRQAAALLGKLSSFGRRPLALWGGMLFAKQRENCTQNRSICGCRPAGYSLIATTEREKKEEQQ
ncbi:MAG: hypothetical protein JO000_13685 [Alphaproteobacteria bacterium]|nr:hypothetical protein [Alphaproteobacteria bacterium]